MENAAVTCRDLPGDAGTPHVQSNVRAVQRIVSVPYQTVHYAPTKQQKCLVHCMISKQ